MNKPKLLVLTSSYPKWKGDFNGTFIHELNIELFKYFEIFVIAPYAKNLKKNEIIDGITIYRFKQFFFNVDLAYGTDILVKIKNNFFLIFIIPFFLLNQFILLAKLIKKEKILLIQTHWIIPQALIAIIFKKLFNNKIKVYGSILGADINSFKGNLGIYLKKFILKNLDGVTAQSIPLVNEVKKICPDINVYNYPISVNLDKYNPNKSDNNLRKELGIEGAFLLFIATLIERKGIRFLINAIPEILNYHPKTKLVVVGDGILREEMELLVKSLKLNSNIIFLGSKSPKELPLYFASCDIFILPSLSEGFPLVVMYALSSGIITVVSDLPVFNQLGINEGFLNIVNINKEGELSKKIINILDQPTENLISYKLRAREYAELNFDITISAKNLSSLILTSSVK